MENQFGKIIRFEEKFSLRKYGLYCRECGKRSLLADCKERAELFWNEENLKKKKNK